MRFIFKLLTKLLLAIVAFVVFYLVGEFALSRIPTHKNNIIVKDYEIFVTTNGTHTDLILPIGNDIKDWHSDFNIPYNTPYKYLGFGWGHRKFFLETPSWGEVKGSTVLNALLGLEEKSLMKVEKFTSIPTFQKSISIWLSKVQYQQLVLNLKREFVLDDKGLIINIPDNHKYYNDNTAFYLAHGRYHAFNTCNTWTNTMLKKVKLKACTWTAFSTGLFKIYDQ